MIKNKLTCIMRIYTKERRFFVFDNDTNEYYGLGKLGEGIPSVSLKERGVMDTAGPSYANTDKTYYGCRCSISLSHI